MGAVLFFLTSGLFLGWSLGANDAANVFGTAVGSRMIRFTTAATICSLFVVLGAVLGGAGASAGLGELGKVTSLAGAFTVALAAALTVYWMTKAGLPVSTTQAIVGGIVGWNLFSGSATDVTALTRIALTWVAGPILGAVFSVILYRLTALILRHWQPHLLIRDCYTRWGLVIAGAFGAYSLGANNIANVMGVFVPSAPFRDLVVGDLLTITGTEQLFLLGAVAISVGVFTYSRRVMLTVGHHLLPLNPVAAWVVVVSHSLVLFLFSSTTLQAALARGGLPPIPLVPVSSSQAVIGAVLGIALAQSRGKALRQVRWRVLGQVASGWVSTPVAAAVLSYLLLFVVQNVFQEQVFAEAKPLGTNVGPWVASSDLIDSGVSGPTSSAQYVQAPYRLEKPFMLSPQDVAVTKLGPCRYPSSLRPKRDGGFVDESARILRQFEVSDSQPLDGTITFEKAGPRANLFFNPADTTAAIVTCGGLSPGLNNVIRSATLELIFNYGVRRVLGIQYGYRGLNPEVGEPPVELTPDFVERIHYLGGTVLGSSRGPQPPEVIVDYLEREQVDVLLCVGGDGTQRGAHAIEQEVMRRGLKKSIIGIPKTIDNDIPYVTMTFGYATALSQAEHVLRAAHTEARQVVNGIGLVRLMGRDAGFVAAGAALISQEANFVLVPEIPFPLDGEDGLLAALERRILARAHALIVVAEGAGQHLFPTTSTRTDASGNAVREDIGLFLRDRIAEHFATRQIPVNIKYLDPSYLIRSVPAIGWDMFLSDQMARHAVHAAMAGLTDALVGSWYNHFMYIPIRTVVQQKKTMNRDDMIWTGVLAATGQPRW